MPDPLELHGLNLLPRNVYSVARTWRRAQAKRFQKPRILRQASAAPSLRPLAITAVEALQSMWVTEQPKDWHGYGNFRFEIKQAATGHQGSEFDPPTTRIPLWALCRLRSPQSVRCPPCDGFAINLPHFALLFGFVLALRPAEGPAIPRDGVAHHFHRWELYPTRGAS